ncbi:chorismate mutase [Chryseobacterium defluvii]|uniref:Chorismate mutase n=1 Tax=Chryseobacterium defluvii TaxID=160396 RepID=A0A840KKB2_9FLAO|nr:hypothetical protein [Chryseobacterium defluvii]MBB4807302.1 chorismate mutase [Chryseobacterium defluvii]
MNNEILEKRLKELKSQIKQYDFIIKKLFDNPLGLTDSEREIFISNNKPKIIELEKIRKEISKIEWQLMTPLQQKDYLEKYSED